MITRYNKQWEKKIIKLRWKQKHVKRKTFAPQRKKKKKMFSSRKQTEKNTVDEVPVKGCWDITILELWTE